MTNDHAHTHLVIAMMIWAALTGVVLGVVVGWATA